MLRAVDAIFGVELVSIGEGNYEDVIVTLGRLNACYNDAGRLGIAFHPKMASTIVVYSSVSRLFTTGT